MITNLDFTSSSSNVVIFNMNKISLYCLKYAESTLPESMVFTGGNGSKKLPIAFAVYLIKIGNRNILIDAGCDTMPGFVMKKHYSPSFVVREADVTADEITDVVITHSHHDHIEGLKHFKNAIVHIQKNEYESGKKYIPDGFTVSTFENELELTPGIKIIEWGGHSVGSSVVEIKTDTVTHVLAGDECYTNWNIQNKIGTGASLTHAKSNEFVQKYSDEKYVVHTCHDSLLKTERLI